MTAAKQNNAAADEFARLQAAFKQRGHVLGRAFDAHTGQPRYYASKWGYIKPLADLDAAAQFLKQIGGVHAGD